MAETMSNAQGVDLTALFPGGFDVSQYAPQAPAGPAEFAEAARAAGLRVDHVTPDGRVHRVPDADDKRGRASGWYVLHDGGDFFAGAFGSWRGDWQQSWSSVDAGELDEAARAAHARAVDAMKRAAELEREQRQREAAVEAAQAIDHAGAASPDHPYIVRKGIEPYGAKRSGNYLIVPVLGEGGGIMSAQRIAPDGTKRFLAGGKTAGGYFRIRGADERGTTVVGGSGDVFVCEGWATGATIRQLTGKAVYVAFNAGNLAAVARYARNREPGRTLVIAADNDAHTAGNPGLEAGRKAAAETGARLVYPGFSGEAADDPGNTDFNDMTSTSGAEAVRAVLAGEAAESAPAKRELFMGLGELAAGELRVDWLIRGMVELEALGMLFGPPASGKSFLALDWALCVAADIPWQGREVEQGVSVYIAGEGGAGYRRRVRAWLSERGDEAGEPDKVPFYLSTQPFSLTDKAVVLRLADEVRRLAAGRPVKHITIDTLARNFGGGNEDSAQDMGRFIENIDLHLRVAFGATVVIVHHTGYNSTERARGSNSGLAAVDAQYRVTQSQGMVTLACTKMKDGEKPPEQHFELVTVDLGGADQYGDPITSCVLRPGVELGVNLTKSLTKKQAGTLRALREISERDEFGEFGPVHIDEWRRQAILGGAISAKSKPAVFEGHVDKLVEAGMVSADFEAGRAILINTFGLDGRDSSS